MREYFDGFEKVYTMQEEFCRVLCSTELTEKDVERYKWLIDRNYLVTM
jgi:hypothetical protein